MKKIVFIFSIFVYGIALGQVPQKLSYQAVIRDASNNIVSNQPVGIRISIIHGSPTGTPVYIETHNPMTNTDGLVSIEIAGGAVVSGAFSAIDWSKTPYFLFTELDPTGGVSYSIFSTTELMSVPYALFAERTRSPGPAGPQGVQGPSGTNGTNGIGVNNAQVVNDSLKIVLTNGNIINSGYIKGAKGDTGIQGSAGANGISVTNTQVINDSLKITLSNGTEITAGYVKGTKGDTGISIMNVQVINDSLKTTLSDGKVFHSGLIANANKGFIVYDQPGSFSFVVPYGINRIIAEIWGAGGGGSGAPSGQAGSGGGGGSYGKNFLNVNQLDTLIVIVGIGGLGGNGNNPGVGGTSSSVGSSFFAGGGSGGQVSQGGIGGSCISLFNENGSNALNKTHSQISTQGGKRGGMAGNSFGNGGAGASACFTSNCMGVGQNGKNGLVILYW
jgi:hypothetical protein